jgi:hypothetical protein
MNDAVEALIRRLERSLSLTYDAAGSGARPCRAGELFRVRLGKRHFALKLYEQGYFNDAYLFGRWRPRLFLSQRSTPAMTLGNWWASPGF